MVKYSAAGMTRTAITKTIKGTILSQCSYKFGGE